MFITGPAYRGFLRGKNEPLGRGQNVGAIVELFHVDGQLHRRFGTKRQYAAEDFGTLGGKENTMASIQRLQQDVQTLFEYQEEMTRLKKQTKEMNSQVKTLSDSIMSYLQSNNIGSCRAGEYCLSVETKRRLATMTAKDVLNKAKTYFNIPETKFAAFLEQLTREREENAKVTTALTKKVAKADGAARKGKAAAAAASTTTALPPPVDRYETSSLSSAIDSIYN